ncbi:MAG: hypothetical protein V4732_15755 [Pseudomonadota bacterium]
MNRKFFLLARVFTLTFFATIFTLAPNAQAWNLFDDLRPSGIAKWSCWASEIRPGIANGCGYFKGISVVNARYRGIVMSDIYDLYGVTGWSDVGRPVSLPSRFSIFYVPYTLCKAQMTVLPDTLTSPDVRLEVIDAASWTYIQTETVPYPEGVQPTSVIATPWWAPSARNIFVRIGIIGNGYFAKLYIDDMAVSCI